MRQEILASIKADAPIYYMVGITMMVFIALLLSVGVMPFRPSSYINNALLYLAAFIMFEGPIFLFQLFRHRPDSPFAFAAEFLRGRKAMYLAGLPVIIAAIVFMPMFSAMKSSIPHFSEFTWDMAFIEADRALFGDHAWLAFQPFLGYPLITSFLSVLYHGWLLLIYSGTIFFALYRPELRQQYFLSFFSIWAVIGVAMAIGFASVGPAFLEPLLGDRTFVDQIAYLETANQTYPVLTLRVQQILLDWYFLGEYGIGRGITAMPSMHIALATIFWLGMRTLDRRLGLAAFLFLVAIFLGSVHLAYHYAVDGIVAFVAAVAIWKAIEAYGRVSGGLRKRRASAPPAIE